MLVQKRKRKTKGFPNFPAWHCGVKSLLNFLAAMEILSELVTTLDHKKKYCCLNLKGRLCPLFFMNEMLINNKTA